METDARPELTNEGLLPLFPSPFENSKGLNTLALSCQSRSAVNDYSSFLRVAIDTQRCYLIDDYSWHKVPQIPMFLWPTAELIFDGGCLFRNPESVGPVCSYVARILSE